SASLAAAIRSAYQPGVLEAPMTYLVHAGPATAWARAESTNIEVGIETPDFSSDTTIHAGPEIRLLLAGTMSASDALASGAVEVEGPPLISDLLSRVSRTPGGLRTRHRQFIAKTRMITMKLSINLFKTLNGVSQAPGGPDEDTRGGFTDGGWLFTVWDTEIGRAHV